jgi:hypothetical protein
MRTQAEVTARGNRRESLRRKNGHAAKLGPMSVALNGAQFARVLGREPQLEPVGMQVLEHLQAVCETFGPPEQQNSTAYWNFIGDDGKLAGTLYHAGTRKTGVLTIKLAAAAHEEALQQWVFDRVGRVTNGDATPRFLEAHGFEIRRVA